MRLNSLKFIFTLLPFFAICQNKEIERSLSLGFSSGKVLIHSKSIENIGTSNPKSISLNFFWRKTDEKSYNKYSDLPSLSTSLQYIDFQNNILQTGIIGSYSIHPTIFYSKIFEVDTKIGIGLAYLTNPYQSENQAYSSPISTFLTLGINSKFNISKKFQICHTVGINHISNGGLKLPNKGINWLESQFQLNYFISQKTDYKYFTNKYSNSKYNKTNFWKLYLFASSKNLITKPNQNKPILGIHLQYSHQVGRSNSLLYGVEHFLDYAQLVDNPLTSNNFHKTGLLIGHEFLWGSIHFNQQIGIYLHATPKGLSSWYHRWGLDYHCSNHIILGVNLLAHGVVAYFPDLRIGFTF